MSRRHSVYTALSSLVVLFLPVPSHAGYNASGSAWLSWDEAAFVTDLRTVPSNPFPLFVQLKNAPDVRALAIHLRWSPLDPLGQCYSVLPATGTATCGAAVSNPPGAGFEGDTSYTWSIKFSPLDSGRACVEYLVSAGSCAGIVPADFLLASVVVMDSKGAVDTLKVGGGATTLGGSHMAIDSVDPLEIPAHRQTVLAIRGRDFLPGAQVELRDADSRAVATKVVVLGGTLINATIKPPDSPGAQLDLAVRLPDGRSALLPSAIGVSPMTLVPQNASSTAKPTNDAAAFRKFDLNADRVSQWNIHDHTSLYGPGRPVWSNNLLVVRSTTDTMGLFRSIYGDGIDLNCGCQGVPSYVGYAVTPPQYATSIGMLSMAEGAFNGTGAFNDYNVPALRVTWTFTDGDSASQTVRIGKHIRNHFTGSQQCNGTQPYYTLVPDSLAAPLDSVFFAPPGETGLAYFDAQEMPLDTQFRSKKLAALRVDAVDYVNFCGTTHFSDENWLYGFSIWPNFRVKNAQGQPVLRKSQFTNQDHGGYLSGITPVGTRRTTNLTGCQVASMAMAYSYAGFPCEVDSLNIFLQRSQGFEPDRVATVTFVSASGDSIRYKATGGTVLKVNDTFLVEHGMYTNPLATYRVTAEGPSGHATRIAAHSVTIPSVGDPGRVYWKMKPRIADSYTHNPKLQSRDLPMSPGLAAEVESLLVRNMPVQLNVPGHFVVADGWTSSFRPDGSARGTYHIVDPYDPRNYVKLIEGKYANTFGMARFVVPAATQSPGPTAATAGPLALGVLASGARRVEIIDPLGRRILRDATSGEGVYEIPDASIEDLSSEHDNGGDVDDQLTGYDVDIPTAFNGHYTIRVYADNGLSVSASGYDANGIFSADDVADTTGGPSGNVYDVLYNGSLRSVTLTHLSTLGVATTPFRNGVLRVARCPTAGPVEFVVGGSQAMEEAIEVFDISGRRRAVVPIHLGPASQVVSWDWRVAGCRPGLYLARLRSRSTDYVRFAVFQ